VHASADYFNPEALALYSTIVRTLRERFTHVLIVPGSKIFFLASDNPLSIEISGLIDRRAIPTEYVNRYYIDDASNRERSDGITGRLDPGAPLNTDFTPVAYYRQLQYWLSYSNVTIWIPVCFVLVILGFILRRLNAVSFGILTTGFAASGIEVLLLFSFQILYGIMYQATGFIIAVFMAGLALGSWYAQQRIREPSFSLFKRIQWMIALTAVVIPGVLMLLREIHFGTMMIYCIFIIITMVISVLIGAQFSIAVRLLPGTTVHVSSTLYAVDLLGSAFGAIGVSVVLIPVAGMTGAFFAVALLTVLSVVVSIGGKNIQSGTFNPRGSNV
jgi:spermidine synthase